MKTIVFLVLTCVAFSITGSGTGVGQELAYGPGDKVFLSGQVSLGFGNVTHTVIVSPTKGDLCVSQGDLTYLPDVAATGEDRFVISLVSNEGVQIQLEGRVSSGQVSMNFGFERLLSTGLVKVTGELSSATPNNCILHFDSSGLALLSADNGLYVTVVTGVISRSSFAANFWGDWYDWFHGIGNALFPGSATNNSSEPVLVWSDLTGYYYLPPGETSASGDCVDFIYTEGSWFKIPGVTIGHVDIGPDGIPEVPIHTYGTPVGMPAYPYPVDLTPVVPGGWTPPDSFPIPVPHVCQMIDW